MTGCWWWVALLEADDLVLVLLLLSLQPSILQDPSSFFVELRPEAIFSTLSRTDQPRVGGCGWEYWEGGIVIICHFLSFSVISSARSGRNRMEDNKQETRRNTSAQLPPAESEGVMSEKFGGNELGWLDWAVSQSALHSGIFLHSNPPSSPLPPVSTPGEAAAVCSSLSLSLSVVQQSWCNQGWRYCQQGGCEGTKKTFLL